MYLTRNQAYRKVPWVRIPPAPPKAHVLHGLFGFSVTEFFPHSGLISEPVGAIYFNYNLQISTDVCNIRVSGSVTQCAVLSLAASEAARKSKSGKGKLDESQGRKASGLHDQGHLPAGLPSRCAQDFDVASPFIC